jgi:hypothetical protein
MLRTVARLLALALPVGGVVLGSTAPAHAGAGDNAEAQACGGASYCVQVSYSGPAAPSGPSGGGYVASVPPKCYWKSWKSPEQALEAYKEFTGGGLYSGKEWTLGLGGIDQYKDAIKNNPDATWYYLECPGLDSGDWDGQVEYAGLAAQGNGWSIPNLTLLVQPGEAPPAPDVDVEVLRDAAYDSIDIPDPQIQRNPEVAGTEATLVNLDTMFWAEDYLDEYWIEASVGPVWARVTADAQDFVLTSPAGGQVCTYEQFTTPYTGGEAPDGACAFPFTRGSTGYAAGFPVTATATWGASWTSSETPGAQPLPTVTTDSTVEVPVAESQALVRQVG